MDSKETTLYLQQDQESRMSHQLSMCIPWKPDSSSLPNIMEKPENLCISPILSHRESSKKSSNRHDHNSFNNPSLEKPSIESNNSTTKHKKSSSTVLVPRTSDLLLNPENQKQFL